MKNYFIEIRRIRKEKDLIFKKALFLKFSSFVKNQCMGNNLSISQSNRLLKIANNCI